MRPHGEILEELVSQVRGLGARVRDLDPDFMDRELKIASRSGRDLDPRMIDELMHGAIDSRDGDLSLLILAGLIREPMPWLAEVLVESHRELKSASPKQARDIAHRLMRLVDQTARGRIGDRFLGRTKAGQMLMMEMPMYIDRAISSRIEFRTKIGEINAEGQPDGD